MSHLAWGVPSTFATIVETVLSSSRGYAELQDKSIVPTERGMQLAAFLERSFSNIINLNYTKEMEDNLDKIASGKKTKLSFLQESYNMIEEAISKNDEAAQNAVQLEDTVCPSCGGQLAVRRSRFGALFIGCNNFPKCRYTKSLK